jgi:DNA mismatch repair protein MutS2
MYSGTLRALEFDRIREALASFALTPPGAHRLAHLEPRTSRRDVESGLAETTEGVRLIGEGPGVPLRAPADLEDTLDALEIEGRPLEGLRLIALAEFLASIEQARGSISKLPAHTFPILTALVARAARFEREVTDIRRAIDPGGDVVDHASPELRQIRENLRRARGRLRQTLESYTRGRDTARYLQDLVVTDRNGRYVLVVKSEHRTSIPGIVHGSSASGASLYLEPLATVELNNDIVALQEREAEEVHRILLALTDAFRGRREDLQRTMEVATGLDVIQAKARLAEVTRASAPTLSTDGRLELRGARHPLLIDGVVARTQTDRDSEGARQNRISVEPVGVDVLLLPPTRVLVITGPNTGGKTVALKAAGLLALMAQAGLHIPAEDGSQVPVFQSIFADIGDEQSIDANLSTFSWHVTNIASMDRALAPPALVLLDEVGAGTDPLEGGALGMAIIDHFRQRGALVIATTHYDPLKSYASTTPEVTAAAFGFDPETFAPTYRLLYGSPGRSLALEMAARLGLPASIVHAARDFRTEREAQLADHLAKMDTDLHALDRERQAVARERTQVASLESQLRVRDEQLRAREDNFTRKLEDSLRERLREARRDIDAVVEGVKKKATALTEEATRRAAAPRLVSASGSASPRLSTGEMGSLRADARAALEQVAERLRQNPDRRPRPGTTGELRTSEELMGTRAHEDVTPGGPEPPAAPAGAPQAVTAPAPIPEIVAGTRVIISPLNLEGVVRAIHGRSADVEVNGKRLRAQLADLRLLDRQGRRESEAKGRADAKAQVTVHVHASAPEGSLSDLNVIGLTVPEAIDRADKFLDQALLAEVRQVRVIHGHGTGQLRRALTDFLHDHPLVSKTMPAPANQGGGGVTLVELRE